MSRPKEFRGKVDVARKAAPLQSNPFAMLAEVDALKNLAPPPPEPKKPAPPQHQKAPEPKNAAPKTPPKAKGRLILRRETKDRGGKVVVVVYGFAEVPNSSAVMIGDLARQLKGRLGIGGSFDRQEIVLQGDRCKEVTEVLESLGYHVRGTTGAPV